MSILLASSAATLFDHLAARRDERLVLLLYAGTSNLAETLRAQVEEPLIVDIEGPRLSRVNFDAVGLVILELTPEQLLSSLGRRLVDVLGRLAQESLDLALFGPAAAPAGAFLQDGVTAGLNLVPRSVVIEDVQAVGDLHALLAHVSRMDVRLLALDGPVVAQYTEADDTVVVHGGGNVMLVAFVPAADDGKTARIQLLHQSMRRGWPQ